mmetsp:Transcript_61965/g.96284  ORF Transcript_61965/g.96284 Transcript_61965/m.96284 type:complete len:84 (-) Transcript_61965:491-742(-)
MIHTASELKYVVWRKIPEGLPGSRKNAHRILGFELFHDIFLELFLVGLDVALPWSDGFLVAYPDLFRDLANESEIVRNEDKAT